jgi:hypothetical protein
MSVVINQVAIDSTDPQRFAAWGAELLTVIVCERSR